MLKMIIADDEAIVRNGLRNVIPWEEFGIRIVAEACDGLEAYDLCQQHDPDILFTDISMPLMDGLELAMKLRENGSRVRVVMISGIQDFNYAKTALDISAEGYVLKPVDVNALRDIIRKVTNRIRLERSQQTEMHLLRRHLQEYLPVLREKFLRSLLQGTAGPAEGLQTRLDYLQLPFSARAGALVCLIQIDDSVQKMAGMSEEDRQLLYFSVMNITEELMGQESAGVCIQLDDNEFALIFRPESLAGNRHTGIVEELMACLKKFLDLSVSAGLGRPVSQLRQLPLSCQEARTALSYKFFTGNGSLLDVCDLRTPEPEEPVDMQTLNPLSTTLAGQLKLGDDAGVRATMEDIFALLCAGKPHPVDYIRSYGVELFCYISRMVADLGESMDELAGPRPDLMAQLLAQESVAELRLCLTDIFLRVSGGFARKHNQKNTRVIQKIQEIIETRYHEDISVARISEEVYLSPNYISMIFRQATGETISEYLTRIRMEEAKKLLRHTDLRVLEVAEKVGYEDAHYFTKVFKKVTGLLPQKFRG